VLQQRCIITASVEADALLSREVLVVYIRDDFIARGCACVAISAVRRCGWWRCESDRADRGAAQEFQMQVSASGRWCGSEHGEMARMRVET
jgi:hypothetical protein